jgi:peptidoglycan/xylan/chitin deacetylase (PgdA/CDA1 family)
VRFDGHFACLTYHVIGDDTSQYAIRESQLRNHLAFLKSEGYLIDDFEGLEATLALNRCIASRYVILTIDDGHESSMRAAEVLQAYGCRATFFLTRDRCLNKQHFIRELQIRELRKAGFSVGTHGTTHRKLTFMPAETCTIELSESKEWLEDVVGEPVRYMAAPGGYINGRVLRLAYKSGYVLIGTCREKINLLETTTLPGTVHRVNIRQHFSIDDLCSAVNGHVAFYTWRQIRAAALVIPKQVLR